MLSNIRPRMLVILSPVSLILITCETKFPMPCESKGDLRYQLAAAVVVNAWYYMPIAEGKNAWLLSQALCVALYLAGVIMMFNSERHAL